MEFKEIEAELKEFVQTRFNLKDLVWECEPDYRDEISDEQIQEILSSKNPWEEFNSLFEYWDFSDQWDYLFDALKKEFEYWEEFKEEIKSWCYENIYMSINLKQYLNQDVCMNLMIDTGDGNYDFTLNSIIEQFGKIEEISKESSIVWLLHTQGYTKKDLVAEFKQSSGNKFLASVKQELMNCTTSMNALTFFTTKSLKDAMNLKEEMKKPKYYYTIEKHHPCGLLDVWNGAGSVLEIKLEKEIKVPVKYIDSFSADGVRGCYSVESIYGLGRGFWG